MITALRIGLLLTFPIWVVAAIIAGGFLLLADIAGVPSLINDIQIRRNEKREANKMRT